MAKKQEYKFSGASKTVQSKKRMLAALEKSLGVVTSACQLSDTPRSTHKDWVRLDSEYKRAFDEMTDIAIDFAESQLYKQIKEGSTAATIFFLKTKGKKRGWEENSFPALDIDGTSINIRVNEVLRKVI